MDFLYFFTKHNYGPLALLVFLQSKILYVRKSQCRRTMKFTAVAFFYETCMF